MSEPTTPLMQQYHAIKARYPHALLLFRLGDFYELFYEDAIIAARELQITLTSRNKEKGRPIPMCGVPYHAAEGYIARLIRAGFKIAICDQMEQPGPGKKLVRREVVRVITPGTATEGALLDARENNFLASVARHASLSSIFRPANFRPANSQAHAPRMLFATNSNCSARGRLCFPGRNSFSKRQYHRSWKVLAAWNPASKIGSFNATMPRASCANNLASPNSRDSALTITRKRSLRPAPSYTISAKTPLAVTALPPPMKTLMPPAPKPCGISTACATTSNTTLSCSIPFPSAIWSCSRLSSPRKPAARAAPPLSLLCWTPR